MLCKTRNILRLRRVHSVNEDLDGLSSQAQPLAQLGTGQFHRLVHEIPATIPWPQAPWPTNVATTFLSQWVANLGIQVWKTHDAVAHLEFSFADTKSGPIFTALIRGHFGTLIDCEILSYFARFAVRLQTKLLSPRTANSGSRPKTLSPWRRSTGFCPESLVRT